MAKEVLTVGEVAEELRIDVSTVRRLIYRKTFPGAFKAGRAWRIPRADLVEYIEKQRRDRQAE